MQYVLPSLFYLDNTICDNCKKGKMILPGYDSPKTLCFQCWEKALRPSNNFLLNCYSATTGLVDQFSTLTTKAIEFLARGGYFYPWEMVFELILRGSLVYQQVGGVPKLLGRW